MFTKFGLWTQLNVSYPKDDAKFLSLVVMVSLALAVIFFAIAFYQYKAEAFKKTFLVSLIFILGIGLPTIPWLIKNISEVGINNLQIGGLLNGK